MNSNVRTLRNYVDGQWVESESPEVLEVQNPSTGDVIAGVPLSTSDEADRAIEAAHRAFQTWREVPVSQRIRYLLELLSLLRRDEEKVCRVLVEEMGKSLPDARAETSRTLQNIETACAAPVLQQGDKAIGVSQGMDGEVLRLPMGVFTMIAPFNFPAMVPFWFIPYALATGNTYVVKPSELVPCTMQLITEYIDQVGLPPGVFNVVNGDKRVADAFIDHPKVQGVSFVGSTRVAKIVAEKCAANNKRYQAQGGAKNHLVVMKDAHIDRAVANMITSCYGCAGQRCMAASVIVCVGAETHEIVLSRFLEASRRVIVANPLDPAVADEPVVVGPVISAQAKQFIHEMIDVGIREGASLVLDGRDITVPGGKRGFFVGPTVFDRVQAGMRIHQTEIFGPVVCVMEVGTLDEAIEIINNHSYGNGASIYTQSGVLCAEVQDGGPGRYDRGQRWHPRTCGVSPVWRHEELTVLRHKDPSKTRVQLLHARQDRNREVLGGCLLA